jgi:hypothetical protein
MDAILGVAGPEMDPRRGEYADFPPTSGDVDAVNGQPEDPAPAGPNDRPETGRRQKT